MRHACLRLAIALFFAACGGSSTTGHPDGSTPDGSLPIDAPDFQICGDGMVQGTEQCDDGNDIDDDACHNNCTFTCGDGVVAATETCDTAIPAGVPGACPTSCDDGDACTTDALNGSACQATCVHGAITAFVNGDGCCPPGGNSTNDSDCSVSCGNGIVEAGETCDTGITAGMPGACPMSCDDGQACTTDSLNMAGTCMATCTNTPITMPINGDGCCPAGATPATDNDCSALCGNGVVNAGETCDTGIATGAPGACPTSCDDANACTTDTLLSGGTCSAACSHTAITVPVTGDGCCPPGANSLTDGDCAPVCGNGIVEAGEMCDDGNTTSGDGCSSTCQIEIVTTAMRFSNMYLRDPHVYVDFIGLSCNDVTDTALLTFPGVNPDLNTNIQTDGNADGNLDLSPILLFEPLNQTTAATTPMEVLFGTCTAPIASTTCSGAGATLTPTTGTNMAVTCLTTIPGTTSAYTPAVVTPGPSCFVTGSISLPVTLSGITINLQNAQIAGTYSGTPASGLVNGLVRGFISEADANATILPMTLPLIGGHALSSVLAGGTGSCMHSGTVHGAPGHDDRDVGPDGVTMGWYFYLNFSATVVPYTP
jgi:cysteine-rich repeat protein